MLCYCRESVVHYSPSEGPDPIETGCEPMSGSHQVSDLDSLILNLTLTLILTPIPWTWPSRTPDPDSELDLDLHLDLSLDSDPNPDSDPNFFPDSDPYADLDPDQVCDPCCDPDSKLQPGLLCVLVHRYVAYSADFLQSGILALKNLNCVCMSVAKFI